MPFDGSGNYTPAAAPNFPAVGGATIQSAYYNNVINDIATALTNCLTRDGQGKPTANIDWNNKNLSNVNTLTVQSIALTNALDVAEGGTGATSFTANYLLKGNGTSAVAISNIFDNGTNIGFGIASPVQYVHIRKDQNGTTGVLIHNRNGSGTPISAVQFISGPFDLGDDRYAMISSGGGSNTTLQFWTCQGAAPTEKMRIDSAGNVGIGTTSPGTKLDVAGSIRTSATISMSDTQSILWGTSDTAFITGQSGAGIGYLSFGANNEILRIAAGGAVTSPAIATAVGYKGLPQNEQTANYTLVLTDFAKEIYLTGTTAGQTVTIPANASVAFPVGTLIQITNDTNQNWSVAITSDTMVWIPSGTTGTRTLAQYGKLVLEKKTATRWWVSGIGVT